MAAWWNDYKASHLEVCAVTGGFIAYALLRQVTGQLPEDSGRDEAPLRRQAACGIILIGGLPHSFLEDVHEDASDAAEGARPEQGSIAASLPPICVGNGATLADLQSVSGQQRSR